MEGYTIKEASLALQVSTKTVRNYINKGLLQATKVHGRWIVDVESIRNISKNKIGKKMEIMADISTLFQGKFLIDEEHYEDLLKQVGRINAMEELLLEYKSAKESLEEKVKKLESEVESYAKGGWRRVLRRRKEKREEG